MLRRGFAKQLSAGYTLTERMRTRDPRAMRGHRSTALSNLKAPKLTSPQRNAMPIEKITVEKLKNADGKTFWEVKPEDIEDIGGDKFSKLQSLRCR